MNELYRIRALADIHAEDWISYNPLFLSSVPSFDESFDRGVMLDMKYYVPRKPIKGDSFESDLLDNLFSTHSSHGTKVYTLKGSVGAGKTSVCRYLHEVHQLTLPSCLIIRVDVWPVEETTENNSRLNELFLEATYNSLRKKEIVSTRKELYIKLLESMGFSLNELTPKIILQAESEFEYKHIIDYLSSLNLEKILIIFDNIDETTEFTIKNCQEYAMKIVQVARSREKRGSAISILFPLREYTVHRHFFQQERFAHIDITPIDEATVLASKLSQACESIKKSAAKNYTQQLSYERFSRHAKKHFIYGPKITITPNSICDFLQDMSSVILSNKETTFLKLMRSLSGGNLKILVGNSYNFIHSCKLPLVRLFEKVFIPDEYQRGKQYVDEISFNLALECLMTIHYPFFDHVNSHIINLFNATNSNVPGDYRNTLIMPRLLCYMNNTDGGSYSSVVSNMELYGYTLLYIENGLNRLFEHGLIESDHGCKTSDLSKTSSINISSVGKFYINEIIKTTNYTQLVCEDVPMCHEYVIPIENKYIKPDGRNHGGDKTTERINSSKKFIEFLHEDEFREREYIEKTLDMNWDNYIYQHGLRVNNIGVTIAEFIEEHDR